MDDIRLKQRMGRDVQRRTVEERASTPKEYLPIDQRVIDWLNDQIQETRLLNPSHNSAAELWYREGQRSLVACLQRRHDSQVELDRNVTK